MSPSRLFGESSVCIPAAAQKGVSAERLAGGAVSRLLWSEAEGSCFGLNYERFKQERKVSER